LIDLYDTEWKIVSPSLEGSIILALVVFVFVQVWNLLLILLEIADNFLLKLMLIFIIVKMNLRNNIKIYQDITFSLLICLLLFKLDVNIICYKC
jgi:hypothetical protein